MSPDLRVVCGIRDGDQVAVLERQVQACLVAQMFDPFDKAVLAIALADLFGPQAD